MRRLNIPQFPADFAVAYVGGVRSYWVWWPPDGSGELHVSAGGLSHPPTADLALADAREEPVTVSWEYGPETESGPFENCNPDEEAVQEAVDRVVLAVNEERQMTA